MPVLFGQTEPELAAEETGRLSLRADMMKRVALGGSWSIGAAVVVGVFEFLKSDPRDAFPMLRSWGPWAIFAIIAIFILYDLAKTVLNIGVRLTHAIERLATAQQQAADKDDRQMQEMATLTSYTAQQSEKTRDTLAEIKELLVDLKGTRPRSGSDVSPAEGKSQ